MNNEKFINFTNKSMIFAEFLLTRYLNFVSVNEKIYAILIIPNIILEYRFISKYNSISSELLKKEKTKETKKKKKKLLLEESKEFPKFTITIVNSSATSTSLNSTSIHSDNNTQNPNILSPLFFNQSRYKTPNLKPKYFFHKRKGMITSVDKKDSVKGKDIDEIYLTYLEKRKQIKTKTNYFGCDLEKIKKLLVK